MAAARRHRDGFHNLKPLDNTADTDSASGTYYIQPSPEKKPKRWPNMCTMFWIFIMFCFVFILGGFLGYYFREATSEEYGSSRSEGPGETKLVSGGKHDRRLDPKLIASVHENIMYDITGESIAKNLRHLPDYRNTMAGGEWDKLSALKVKVMLEKLSFDHVELHEHQVVLSFPDAEKPNRLQILNSTGDVVDDWSVTGSHDQSRDGTLHNGGRKSPNVTDVPVAEHDQIPHPYVAYSGTGTVKGRLVYGHYGRVGDLAVLGRRNINTTGAMFLLRLGHISITDKVRNVAAAGARGVLLYWDPQDVHKLNSSQGGLTGNVPYAFLDGPEASTNGHRLLVQTVSMAMAKSLLKKLRGTKAPLSWQGGLNVTYRLGTMDVDGSAASVQLTVNNQLKTKTIYNVVATIHGALEPDRYVLIGAPRTSFPDVAMETKLSTAMLLSTAQALHDSLSLASIDWMPHRTVKVCSWSGSEFSDIGMRLYMKDRLSILEAKAVAYLELSKPVRGNQTLNITATPAMQSLIHASARKVPAPSNSQQTLYSMWAHSELVTTGLSPPALSYFPTGGQGFPFLNQLGISTVRYQFAPDHHFHVAHTESEEVTTLESHDSLHHLRNHAAIARVTAVTMLSLVDADFYAQFNMSDYGTYIFNRVKSLVNVYRQKDDSEIAVLIEKLQQVALEFLLSAQSYEIFTPVYISKEDRLTVRRFNDHYMLLDRSLRLKLTEHDRTKHLIDGSNTDDLFSLIGQYIRFSRHNGDWNRTIQALESLTDVLTHSTLTLRVGE